jgi:hypothetical protein
MSPPNIYCNIYCDAGVHPIVMRELERIFDRAAAAFDAITEDMPDVVVTTSCAHAVSKRNFAAVSPLSDPVQLYLCADLTHQPITRIRGILWHEAGHVILERTRRAFRQLLGVFPLEDDPKHPLYGLDEEQKTDAIVQLTCGVKIYYDDDLVQRAGPGARGIRPRPAGLK